METLTEKALIFSANAHGEIGQKRKYTNEPYHTHPVAVCLQVQKWIVADKCSLQRTDLDATGAVACLHDVLEDTQVTYLSLLEVFGRTVTDNVLALTDEAPVEGGPNRSARKAATRQRLAGANLTVQLVKLADLADNAKSIKEYDQPFYKVFRREAVELINALDKLPSDLRYEVLAQL